MYVSRKESEWWVGCTTYILLGSKLCQTKSNSLFFLFFHKSTLENQKKKNPSTTPSKSRFLFQNFPVTIIKTPPLPLPSPFIIIMINLSKFRISPPKFLPSSSPPPNVPVSLSSYLSIRKHSVSFFFPLLRDGAEKRG